jgi:hypothetical protein
LTRPSLTHSLISPWNSPKRAVVVKDDEALHPDALAQQHTGEQSQAVGARGQAGLVVHRDQAAQGHPGRCVEQGQHGVKHGTPDILEIDVDAGGARCGQLSGQVRGPMVHAFACDRSSDVQQAHVGGEAGHPQPAQCA